LAALGTRFQYGEGLEDVEAICRKGSNVHTQTVLVVAHAWNGDLFGGAFRIATELALGLAANGWHVTYLCCNVNDAPDRETLQGVEIRRYRTRPGTFFAPRFWQHIRSARSLARQIAAEFEIVAVSGHSPLQYLGVLQALSKAGRSRFTYVVHSPFAEEQLASAGSNGLNWTLRCRAMVAAVVDGWCLRGSTMVHCLSRFTAESLVTTYGEWLAKRCVECPGWVDAERFLPVANRKPQRAALPPEWHTDDPVLLTVRRLESRMGLDTLIAAAAEIAEMHRFRVLIGGTGSQASHLIDAIRARGLEKRVFLLGRIPEEQLPLCYAAADAFILPTRSLECFGLIVLEAFATGTPVIGARVGAIPELLSAVGDDWMFEPGDVNGLAHCVRNFLAGELSPNENLREIALPFDVRRILPKWIEICLGPLAGQQRRQTAEPVN
jgi:glycosyltransferase involved in cell wall biosynthesis